MELEIWSDIACPWCYVGKRRLETALQRFDGADGLTVTWRSFELDPDAPHEDRQESAARLAAKYGMTVEQARESQAQLAATAAGEGITMDFDAQRRGNTFDGHRLIHLAAVHGRQDAMKERLMHAYFSDGELVSDHATLARLAAEVGLPADEVTATLASDRFADAVRGDEHDAAALGISAVPTFVVDRAIGVSGAQSPEHLLALLQEGRERQAPAIVTGGDVCGPDGC